ncbi:hypothetical protein IE53DRAFT_378066 [Violaceomyces palustris]|uniref:Uncharacterized protein n=1 Tax=Violaceomyces palustris TaxID=1673888 RepID=A0ACD0P3F2_9BASI|nr:hypothetical protein IE53DRAFT_378066 [Violaceomyces palustris]
MYPAHNISSPTASPIGGRSFTCPAKIRILLAPAGGVSPKEFEECANHVRNFETIRLEDLPSSQSGRQGPAPKSPMHISGEVHLSFVTSYDQSHSFLAPFNLHRQVLGVLGLALYSPEVDKDSLERAPGALRELHPGALVHRVYAFDHGASRPQTVDLSSMRDIGASITAAGEGSSSPELSGTLKPSDSGGFSGRNAGGLVIFPAVRKDAKDVKFYLKTLISELVVSILDGLDSIIAGLEGTPLETPRETLDGIVPPPSSSVPTAPMSPTQALGSGVGAAASNAASRASALFSSFSSSASNSKTSAAIGGGSQPDVGMGISTGGIGLGKPSAAKKPVKPAKKTQSMVGIGPMGAGRYTKIKADYNLLSGDLWAALEAYDSSMNLLGKERAMAGGQDAAWYASALEGWAVTRVLVCRMGGEILEKAPCFNLPTGGVKEKEKEKEAKEKEYTYSKQPWAEIAEAYSLAITIYGKCLAPPSYLLEPAKSMTNETPRDYTHPLIHAGACVAYARFLLAVWASAGWNGECFDQLVYGGVPPSLAEDHKPSKGTYAKFSSLSGIQRHEIACAASSALTHSSTALKPADQITLLSTLTSIFGCIGFQRREAYLLRQLQSVIVSLLAKAIMVKMKQPETASVPLKHETAGDDHVLGTLISQVSFDSAVTGTEAVLVLAMHICETYGIHVEIDPLKNVPSHHILSRATEGLCSAYSSPAIGGTNTEGTWTDSARPPRPLLSALDLQDEAKFGWAEQQVALLKDAVSVCELLGDNLGMAFFATILLRDFHMALSPSEQWRFFQGIVRVSSSARWQGAQALEVNYWGPAEPVCSLQLIPLPPSRIPHEHPAKDLVSPSKGKATDAGIAGLNNPFFWNPSKPVSSASGKKVMVARNERIELLATLQNPFAIDLEFEQVKLSTEGSPVKAEAIKVVVPAYSYHTVKVTALPLAAGKVIIRGLHLTLAGCASQEFTLPIYDDASLKIRQAKAAELDDKKTRLKVTGLDARSSLLAQREQAIAQAAADGESAKALRRKTLEPHDRFLECLVTQEQPLLRAECPTLVHGSMVLLEGESVSIPIKLINTSSLPIDFVKLTFSDDLSESTKAALAEGDLLPSDAHELEWDLLHRPVFSFSREPRSIRIAAGGSTTLCVTLTGKLECTNGRIQIDYGHLDAPGRGGLATEEAKPFYTRQIMLAINLTVYPVVECSPLTVRPLRAPEAARLTAESLAPSHSPVSSAKQGSDGERSRLLESNTVAEEDTFCLISLDVRNVHPHNVLVYFELNTGGVRPLGLKREIPSGSTSRISLPFPRRDLPEEKASAPIPSLSSRQFIVSRVKLSEREEMQSRMRFWYRDELLSKFRATWMDCRTGKRGVLSLRDQVLQDGDVSFIKKEEVTLELGLRNPGELELKEETTCEGSEGDLTNLAEKPPPSPRDLTATAVVEEFVEIIATIKNRSNRPMKLLYRLVPLPCHADLRSYLANLGQPRSNPPPPSPLTNDPTASQVILSDGTFSSQLEPRILGPGQVTKVVKTLCFLATGRFEFVGCLEEAPTGLSAGIDVGPGKHLRDRLKFVGSEPLVVSVSGSSS